MGNIRILIADDHNVFRTSTRKILEREIDFDIVAEAANGEEAVTLVELLKPDIAIIDISMPVMDGIVATENIKQRSPATAILILTNYDDDQFVQRLLKTGVSGYLLKSIHNNELIAAIRTIHDGRLVFDPLILEKVKDGT